MIYGHPEYYPRFGFKNAAEYKVTTSDGKNFDAFMICELYNGSLNGITGCGNESPEFYNINAEEVKIFDKKFPQKL
jgi:predicted N-acetyltransferase YhbS